MTSFDTYESSPESSRPLEVYRITVGPSTSLFTSDPSDVTIGSDVYKSEAIKRGPIVIGQTERQRVLAIDLPLTNEFASQYIGVPPGSKATVEIIRLQRDEIPVYDTQVTIYEGSVKSVEFPRSGTARINLQSVEALTARHMPRYSSMSMCNHTLYGPGCGVNPSSYSLTNAVVTAITDGRTLTVTGAAAASAAGGFEFTGGYLKLSTSSDSRLIIKQSGDDLTIMVPYKDTDMIANITTVDAFAGCDHLLGGDCAQVFDNVINHGGFNWVPTNNIFKQGLPPLP